MGFPNSPSRPQAPFNPYNRIQQFPPANRPLPAPPLNGFAQPAGFGTSSTGFGNPTPGFMNAPSAMPMLSTPVPAAPPQFLSQMNPGMNPMGGVPAMNLPPQPMLPQPLPPVPSAAPFNMEPETPKSSGSWMGTIVKLGLAAGAGYALYQLWRNWGGEQATEKEQTPPENSGSQSDASKSNPSVNPEAAADPSKKDDATGKGSEQPSKVEPQAQTEKKSAKAGRQNTVSGQPARKAKNWYNIPPKVVPSKEEQLQAERQKRQEVAEADSSAYAGLRSLFAEAPEVSSAPIPGLAGLKFPIVLSPEASEIVNKALYATNPKLNTRAIVPYSPDRAKEGEFKQLLALLDGRVQGTVKKSNNKALADLKAKYPDQWKEMKKAYQQKNPDAWRQYQARKADVKQYNSIIKAQNDFDGAQLPDDVRAAWQPYADAGVLNKKLDIENFKVLQRLHTNPSYRGQEADQAEMAELKENLQKAKQQFDSSWTYGFGSAGNLNRQLHQELRDLEPAFKA